MRITEELAIRKKEAYRISIEDGHLVDWAMNVSAKTIVEYYFKALNSYDVYELKYRGCVNNFKLFAAIDERVGFVDDSIFNFDKMILLSVIEKNTIKFVEENAESIFDFDNKPELLLLYKLVVLK